MLALNYEGLKKRETYDEIIDYIVNKQDMITYPDRTAKRLRDTPQLSNLLDGQGEGALEMEEQQKRQMQDVERTHRIRDLASRGTQTAHVLEITSGGGPTHPPVFDISQGDPPDDQPAMITSCLLYTSPSPRD